MMNLFYRGYVIHEDVREVCYTIYDRRPNRGELVIAGDSREAMTWVDRRVVGHRGDAHPEVESLPGLSWVGHDEVAVSAWCGVPYSGGDPVLGGGLCISSACPVVRRPHHERGRFTGHPHRIDVAHYAAVLHPQREVDMLGFVEGQELGAGFKRLKPAPSRFCDVAGMAACLHESGQATTWDRRSAAATLIVVSGGCGGGLIALLLVPEVWYDILAE